MNNVDSYVLEQTAVPIALGIFNLLLSLRMSPLHLLVLHDNLYICFQRQYNYSWPYSPWPVGPARGTRLCLGRHRGPWHGSDTARWPSA